MAEARPPRGGRPRRLEREERTLAVMIAMYCRDHHGATSATVDVPAAPSSARPATGTGDRSAPASTSGAGPLCPDCAALLDYARARLEHCPYGADKPTCAKCPTHCYKPALREQVRAVMRYSGPRMLRAHPLLAAVHLIDGRRRPPGR